MPDYDRILVPTDGSEGVEKTLDHALSLARDHDAVVHALGVVDQRIAHAADTAREEVLDRLHERSDAAVTEVQNRAVEAGLEAVTEVREGVPDREIVDYADEVDAAVIVIGTHGRTGRDRIVNLGSVTERVVESANRPVFVVHIGE
jgi:nucleotide-binding universal stress UspA family protein